MSRAEMRRTMAVLRRHCAPASPTIRVLVSNMEPVPEADPRMGTVEVTKYNPVIEHQATVMYCRDEDHFHQMVDEYYGNPPHTNTVLITNCHPARKDYPRQWEAEMRAIEEITTRGPLRLVSPHSTAQSRSPAGNSTHHHERK